MPRATSQRDAIQHALDEADGPLLPDEILEAAQADCPSLGQATVYRELKRLQAEGEIQRVVAADGRARFEPTQEHHHHFQCESCQRVYDIPGCTADTAAFTKRMPRGFRVESHEVWLHGTCATCS